MRLQTRSATEKLNSENDLRLLKWILTGRKCQYSLKMNDSNLILDVIAQPTNKDCSLRQLLTKIRTVRSLQQLYLVPSKPFTILSVYKWKKFRNQRQPFDFPFIFHAHSFSSFKFHPHNEKKKRNNKIKKWILFLVCASQLHRIIRFRERIIFAQVMPWKTIWKRS